jgi:hypothetical protein
LAAALVAGAATPVAAPEGGAFPLLLPKVHSFFGQGQPLTACLGPFHLSANGGITCTDCAAEDVPAFPLIFCAACGQECITASLVQTRDGSTYIPRDFRAGEDDSSAVYLFPEPWDDESVPADETAMTKSGRPRKGMEGAVPANVIVCTVCARIGNACGHNSGREMAQVQAPLLMCPSCGVIYDGRVREFNKFSIAGAVGRASATDLLVTNLLAEMHDSGKPRVIAFTDNRQDSAFQAGHLTDTDQRFHFRKALFQGLVAKGAINAASGVDLPATGNIAFEAMQKAGTLPPTPLPCG